jgi:surface carbohydrate biosynthesis protein
VNFYLRIEVLARELQGRLLLGLAAAERGHDVVLLDKVTASELAQSHPDRLPIGYFHDNSPGQDGGKTQLHERLYERGFLITGQDEEHGLTTDDFERNMGGRYPARAMRNKAAMFAFGPFDAAGIRQERPEYADRVIVTGSPRVDFWRKDFGAYYAHHPHPLGREASAYMLFLMSASPFFAEPPRMSFTDGDESELLGRADALADEGSTQHTVDAYRRVVRSKLAVEALARQHPDTIVVYRPHPLEIIDAWYAVFEDAPANVRVIRDNAVSPWVRQARCVVFSGSTVGFEAALAGVPAISFQPDGHDTTPAASRMGHRATTREELLPLVASVLSGQELALPIERAAAMQETLASRFFALDGPLAADRIVDAWEALATDAIREAPPIIPTRLRLRPSPRRLARSAIATGRAALRLGPSAVRRQRVADRAVRDQKFPAFDHGEVERIHLALCAALGRFESIRVTQVGPRVLHLRAR